MKPEDFDKIYSNIKTACLHEMSEHGVPATIMDYILSKVMVDIQAMHVSELVMVNEVETVNLSEGVTKD